MSGRTFKETTKIVRTKSKETKTKKILNDMLPQALECLNQYEQIY